MPLGPQKVYISRALDKREYWMIIGDNFSYFSMKPYVLTPHLNCLNETVSCDPSSELSQRDGLVSLRRDSSDEGSQLCF